MEGGKVAVQVNTDVKKEIMLTNKQSAWLILAGRKHVLGCCSFHTDLAKS